MNPISFFFEYATSAATTASTTTMPTGEKQCSENVQRSIDSPELTKMQQFDKQDRQVGRQLWEEVLLMYCGAKMFPAQEQGSNDSAPFRFLDLHSEIRNLIYDHYVAGDKELRRVRKRTRRPCPSCASSRPPRRPIHSCEDYLNKCPPPYTFSQDEKQQECPVRQPSLPCSCLPPDIR
jgi:hypothetical protein